ncbi:MAG: hypothetical protein ACQESN_07265 [Thermotogota bacterium]
MKKLVAIVAVLAMALASFAGIVASGPNYTASVSGSIGFGLLFEETGFDLFVDNGVLYNAEHSVSLALSGETTDGEASLTLNFSAADVAYDTAGSDMTPTFLSATYEDSMMNLGFMNYPYEDTVNVYYLANYDKSGDGLIDDPIGTKYMTANFKGLDLDFTYITLDNLDTRHATSDSATTIVAGDVMAVNMPFAYDMGLGNINAAFWGANKDRTPVTLESSTTSGKFMGFAAGTDWTGAEMVEGLSMAAAFGMQSATDITAFDETAYRLNVNYERAFSVVDDPSMTVTPHAVFEYRTENPFPFAHVDYTGEASYVSAGVDASADLGMAGVFGIYDTVTYDLGASPALSYEYGVTYSNEELHELFKVSAQFGKMDSTEIATPFGLTAKVWGGMTEDMFGFNYMAELTDMGDLVPLTDMASVTDEFMAYDVNVSVYPVENVSIDASLYNYTLDANGDYASIQNIADPVWTLDATYSPNSILSMGGHVGTEENWGDFAAIHWYLFAKATFSF